MPHKQSSSIKKAKLPLLKNIFWRRLLYGVIVLLLVISAIQLTRQSVILHRVNKDNSQLIYEFGQVKEGVIQYGEDLNEMREYLLLPTRHYDFFPEVDLEPEEDNLAFGVYRFVDYVGKDYLLQKEQKSSYKAIKTLKSDRGFLDELRILNLLPARYLEETKDYVKFKFYENKTTPIAGLALDRQAADFYIESILGPAPLEIKKGETLSQAALQYLKDNLETVFYSRDRIDEQKQAMKQLWQSEDISFVLQAKRLQVGLDPSEVEKGFEYVVYNSATEPLIPLWIDRKSGDLWLGDKSYPDVDALQHDLLYQLDQLEGETDYEKTIQNNMEKLRQLIGEPAFAEALNISRLKLEPEREDGSRLYYDLTNIDDEKKVGSIVFETLTGDLKFWRADDNKEYELEDVLGFGIKKNN